MLDKKNLKYLSKLNKLCDGSYKVFEKTELQSTFGLKSDALVNTVKFFQERGYVDVKYDDENVICLTVLPKAFSEIEDTEDNSVIQKKLVKIMFFTALFSAVSAFLGAFIANLIIG